MWPRFTDIIADRLHFVPTGTGITHWLTAVVILTTAAGCTGSGGLDIFGLAGGSGTELPAQEAGRNEGGAFNASTNHSDDSLSQTSQTSDKVDNPDTKAKGLEGAIFIPPPQPNNYGGVSTQYPIDVPPGRAGVQPQISLGYSSSGGDGWVGIGWNLGLGSISRTTKYGQLYYDHRDTFTYGGKRLIKVDGVTNTENGEYRLEIESDFSKFVLADIDDGGVWTVYKADGSRVYYGETRSQRIFVPEELPLHDDLSDQTGRGEHTYTWNYARTVDRNGNYMTAEYDDDLYNQYRILYLKEIRYTGNYSTGFGAKQFVRFLTRKRSDPYVSKAPGFAMTMDRLLDEIIVGWDNPNGSDNEDLWSYEMIYEISEDSGRPLLKTVETDHHSTQPKFSYQPAEHLLVWQKHVNPAKGDPETYPEETRYFEGDFNGDGISDMVYFNSNTGEWKALEGRREGGYLYKTYGQTPEFAGLNTNEEIIFFKGNVTGDYNGDGRSDIAFFMPKTKQFWVAEHNGVVFNFVSYGVFPFDSIDIFKAEWFPGDYDGNGLSDFVLYNEPTGEWFLMSNVGRAFSFIKFGQKFKNLFRHDYNPDSNQDSDFTKDNSLQGKDRSRVSFLTGDYNGDGRTDIALYDDRSGKWWVGQNYRADPLGFRLEWSLFKVFTAPEQALFGFDRFSGDFNGDGLSDFLLFDKEEGDWWLGESSYSAEDESGTINFRKWSQTPEFREITRWLQGDFNGDGRTDIGFYSATDHNFWIGEATADGFRYRIYNNLALGPDPNRVMATPQPKEEVKILDDFTVIPASSKTLALKYQFNGNTKPGFGEDVYPGCFALEDCSNSGDDEPEFLIFKYDRFEGRRRLHHKQGSSIAEIIDINFDDDAISVLENGSVLDYDGDSKDDLLYFHNNSAASELDFRIVTHDGSDFGTESIAKFSADDISNFDIASSLFLVDDFDLDASGRMDAVVLDDSDGTFYWSNGGGQSGDNRTLTVEAGGSLEESDFEEIFGSLDERPNRDKFVFWSKDLDGLGDRPVVIMYFGGGDALKAGFHLGTIEFDSGDPTTGTIAFRKLTTASSFSFSPDKIDWGPSNRPVDTGDLNDEEILYVQTDTSGDKTFYKLVIDTSLDTVQRVNLGGLDPDYEFHWEVDHTGAAVVRNRESFAWLAFSPSAQVNTIDFVSDTEYVFSEVSRPDLVTDVYPFRWIQGDYNGDSKTDIGIFHLKEDVWYFALSQGTVPDMLERIDNGIGGFYKVQYENSSRFDNTGDDDIPDLPMNYKVCTEIVVADGVGGYYTNKYEYKNGFAFSAFIDGKKETDYFGFSEFTVTDAIGGKTISKFYTTPYVDYLENRALSGAIKEKRTLGYDLIEYSREEYEYNILHINQGNGQEQDSFMVEPARVDSYVRQVLATTKTASILLDGYNLSSRTEATTDHYQDGAHSKVTTTKKTTFDTDTSTNQQRVLLQINFLGETNLQVTTKHYYDSDGNLEKQEVYTGTGPLSEPERISVMAYNSYGLKTLDEIQDPDNILPSRTTRYTFDDSLHQFMASQEQVRDAGFSLFTTTDYNYDRAFGKPKSVTDPNGNRTMTSYDQYGRSKYVDVDTDTGVARLSEFDYSASFPLSAKTVHFSGSGDADVESRIYTDGLGRHIHTIQSANGGSPDRQYTKTGKVVYDPLGRVISQSQIGWAKYYEINTYVAHGKQETKNPTLTSYDPSGRVDKIFFPRASISDSEPTYIDYEYLDPWETRQHHSGGQSKKTIKNGRGLLLYVRDYGTGEDGQEVSAEMGFCYDKAGKRIKRMDLNGGVSMSCTVNTSLFAPGMKDSSGNNVSLWEYDALGQVIQSSDPDLGYTVNIYNSFGDIIQTTDSLARTITMTYDRLGRPTLKTLPNDDTVTMHYDEYTGSDNAIGKLAMLDDSAQQKIISYNKRGQIKKETRTLRDTLGDLETDDYITQYKNDLLNRNIRIDYPEDPVTGHKIRVCYAYNGFGYINKVQVDPTGGSMDCDDSGLEAVISQIKYNEFGNRTEVQRGNGAVSTYEYDNRQRMVSKKTIKVRSGQVEEIEDVTYTFNADNTIAKIENDPLVRDEFGSLQSRFSSIYTYEYDGLNRLQTAEGLYDGGVDPKDFKRGFRYKPNGNMDRKIIYQYNTANIVDDWQYSYSGNNHAVTNINTTNMSGADRFVMTYDAVGNMVTQTDAQQGRTKHNTYNYANRVVQVNNPDGATPFEQLVGQYYYDDQGFRVRKIARRMVDVDGTDEFREFESIAPSMYLSIEKQNDSATGQTIAGTRAIVNHIYVDGLRIAAWAPTTGGSFEVRYFIQDQVDSVKVVLDTQGDTVARTEYYPYGEEFVHQDGLGQSEPDAMPKFNSQDLDKESGYYFFNARHYDPQIARFVTADTVIDGASFVSGWNRFAYVHGNPVRFKDPSGHSAEDDAPDASEFKGVTKAEFEKIAVEIGAVKPQQPGEKRIRFNREVGALFEKIVGQSQGLKKNTLSVNTLARKHATKGRKRGSIGTVIPDFIGVVVDSGKRPVLDAKAGLAIVDAPEKAIFEAKAVRKSLTLSTSNQQVRGLVDAASQLRGKSKWGALEFVTTADTKIGRSVKGKAANAGVIVTQSVLQVARKDGKVFFKVSDPSLSNAKELNMAQPSFHQTATELSQGLVNLLQENKAVSQDDL